MSKPDPKFNIGDPVDVFGRYRIIKSKHYDEMWECWFYTFENISGRNPEDVISEPNSNTKTYIL